MSGDMSAAGAAPALLALDAGVSETGWAVFKFGEIEATGIIAFPGSRRLAASARIERAIRCLDELVDRWQPRTVAYSRPSGIRWPLPSLELLIAALASWSQRHGLELYPYSSREVRSAVAGHPNASRDRLAYLVMERLGLIGLDKTTREWEAIAVGRYHLETHI